ncbi:Abhydrolase domain-containing protein 2-A [Aphelenchoides bicaudatus]|nr:Abhydrolase domain-containing protein 2-A [Aphelenchoides bicaudatus]
MIITLNEHAKNKQDGQVLLKEVLSNCPILREKYNPPAIFGKNGHLQTAVYGVLGHSSLKRTFNQRHQVQLPDKTTVTFDCFEPVKPHPSGRDYTIALCPGICNSSESNYIRTCVHNAQEAGYRCAVLNHLGALANVPLTTSRIFSYGSTDELEVMVWKMLEFMGANLTTNFLHTVPADKRDRFLVGLSVCQGYDAEANVSLLAEWESGRRVYNYIITENVKRLLRRNYDMAVVPHVQSKLIDEQRLFATTSILGVDEAYSRRVQGYDSVTSMYKSCSSIHRIPDIQIPMVFLNSADDPLFPEKAYSPVRQLCTEHEKHAFVELKHGGHLGFLEQQGIMIVSKTWLDRFIVELANAAVAASDDTE